MNDCYNWEMEEALIDMEKLEETIGSKNGFRRAASLRDARLRRGVAQPHNL